MNCAKLHLQKRSRSRPKSEPRHDKPRRYCQKRLVDPQFEENNRWTYETQRYNCTEYEKSNVNRILPIRNHHDVSDMFLTVQTLQFKGESQQSKRQRTSFKYKTLNSGQKHRMFVKQVVDRNVDNYDVEGASELKYYLDFSKYFSNKVPSRSSSVESRVSNQNFDKNLKRNKSVQVDFNTFAEIKQDKTSTKLEKKLNNNPEVHDKTTKDEEFTNNVKDDNPKIAFHKYGKRKSITISKAESPETVQVIRVDLVCNYSANSNTEDYNKQNNRSQIHLADVRNNDDNMRRKHYNSKYLLTKSVKALDENVSGGTNVTLLCKTFRLADRSKFSN
ncbi:hypothetical protein RR48_15163 [Papilio machaon]|uniref:Uncharacterized protein n=1 Tax=Papilio machaon TaxID=76193 RepID=A0A194QU77_PAPMA|nr:hypothetical protein RR48_15163 [Papilio machaon]